MSFYCYLHNWNDLYRSFPMIYPEVIIQLYEEELHKAYESGYQDALEDHDLHEQS